MSLAVGAKVDADLFVGYTQVNGGVLLANAANYKTTTIAEAYAAGTFNGITSAKEKLSVIDGCYSVGTIVEIINGLVTDDNKTLLTKEFVGAVYFELIDASGNTKVIVLEQKTYSVSGMVDYYCGYTSTLGITDEYTIKALNALNEYIG